MRHFTLCLWALGAALSACGSDELILLRVEFTPDEAVISPLDDSTVFTATVSGFKNNKDANDLRLKTSTEANSLLFTVEDSPATENSRTFKIAIKYNSERRFDEIFIIAQLEFENIPKEYMFFGRPPAIFVTIENGRRPGSFISVNQANIQAFNRYANTDNGLIASYKLVENIALPQGDSSNWTPIGSAGADGWDGEKFTKAFSGRFDGGGHTISGLVINNPDSDNQGFFGAIEGRYIQGIGLYTSVQNLGLLNVKIRGKNAVGSLVGYNRGHPVLNSIATGSVEGDELVGGLVGMNYIGTVRNTRTTVSVKGNNSVGGLVGHNLAGLVQHSIAMGSVEGGEAVGGLVGYNDYGTVQSSYAVGKVEGRGGHVGGLVGRSWSAEGEPSVVRNCMALNPSVTLLTANSTVGRAVGSSDGTATMENNHAFDGMTGRTWNNPGPNNPNGTGISAAELRTGSNLPAAFKAPPWTYQQGKLPGLFGEAVGMPEHLQ